MSLSRHLVELRRRLLIAVLALIVGMVIAFIVADPVIRLLTVPIQQIAEQRGNVGDVQLMFTTVTSGFDLRMRIAFSIGILISAPIWIWQIWAFLMPGLTRKEIRYTVGFVGAAVPLFFGGLFVGWLIMPHIVELMAQFVPDQAALFYDYSYYYDFILKLLLVVGVAFVLPVFLVALNVAGILSGKGILKGWRIAVLVICLFAAIATPAADIVSMLLLGGILVVLYLGAAGVSLLFDWRKARRERAVLATEGGL
ncbi:twin-arginine translocase subunit TatC [Microbacterium sp. X-17]|uniref:twin-arginine translocase subunit TatC n=1 Tax=Microbacterium sp. X-17 TaxID=3144404 RepID=UPI0031F5909C